MVPAIRIVLVRVRNPLNIGAVARAMANFGLPELVLVDPYDPAWREARSARAGTEVLQHARAVASLSEAVGDCGCVIGTTAGTARSPEIPLEDWPTVAASLPPAAPDRPVALLFGSERTGLAVEEISYCHRLARIPTLPDAPSMNLGQAVAVCAYELHRQPANAPLPLPSLTVEERERLLATWYPLLEQLGVVPPGHRQSQTRMLRRMVSRWQLGPEDQYRLLGVARQVRRLLRGAE
ncbi:MAG TPA: TrmH family RNA methyltransferase [Terriglobales bacterium]|nr:TrmH family RNA methyltransferase [Terriglobales bacterium]